MGKIRQITGLLDKRPRRWRLGDDQTKTIVVVLLPAEPTLPLMMHFLSAKKVRRTDN